jgi:hypothetical protein
MFNHNGSGPVTGSMGLLELLVGDAIPSHNWTPLWQRIESAT